MELNHRILADNPTALVLNNIALEHAVRIYLGVDRIEGSSYCAAGTGSQGPYD